MEIDKITYQDLSIFTHEEEYSIFGKLNFTQTYGGKQELKNIFLHPLKSKESIVNMQQVIKYIAQHEASWPAVITNGTIIMINEYLNSKVPVATNAQGISTLLNLALFKTVKGGDFSFISYSLIHIADFFQGCFDLVNSFLSDATPSKLQGHLQQMKKLLSPECKEITGIDFRGKVAITKITKHDNFIRRHFRHRLRELIELYHQLDAWHSMALAVNQYKFSFPEVVNQQQPYLHATGLYHLLLHQAIENKIMLGREDNFLFLTGANMAGKSTFIKAVGVALFLAHLGMGVPAAQMQFTLFDGILTNIEVQDNVLLGESYFYNEVQRIKNTILKVKDGKNWLILIDELFKGTNIEDAKTCSIAVIKGLSHVHDSLFILSTHLYEIADALKEYSNITFQYFETVMTNGAFHFNYHLKEGISNDRIGYLILKRENVIELLEKITKE